MARTKNLWTGTMSIADICAKGRTIQIPVIIDRDHERQLFVCLPRFQYDRFMRNMERARIEIDSLDGSEGR